MRLLLVEDDARIARFVAKGLQEQSYAVDVVANGNDAVYQVEINDYDVVVLDVMIPGQDGFATCRAIRAVGKRMPILMLTARDGVEDLVMDAASQTVKRGNRSIPLTAKEYALLEFLARNAGRVVGRSEIAEHVWDESFDPFSNLIEVYINRLRRKIDERAERPLLHTRRGSGYILAPPTEPAPKTGGGSRRSHA